jgi:flavin reductase (DIM6/NTAB) family NADH-FMN oxidoreductase RutF
VRDEHHHSVDTTLTDQTMRMSFIDGMSRVATSVTIVTTDGEAGRFGLTVSAMSSVTADPPTLLICVNRRNPMDAAIRSNGVFGVNALRADQRWVAEIFAGRPRRGNPYDFQAGAWHIENTGSPLLTGAVAWFDCVMIAAHHVGTHTIAIGRVVAAGSEPGTPLIYGRRSFGELVQLPTNNEGASEWPYPIWDEPDL